MNYRLRREGFLPPGLHGTDIDGRLRVSCGETGMSIVQELSKMDIEPRKPAGEGVVCGPCPVCGGEDRFQVWLPPKNTYWCRQCGARGGFWRFLCDIRGLSRKDAWRVMEDERRSGSLSSTDLGGSRETDREMWRTTVRDLVLRGKRDLMEDRAMLRYLEHDRGLTMETITAHHLGVLRGKCSLKYADLGLGEGGLNARGEKVVGFSVPSGLLIPNIVHGEGGSGLLIRTLDGYPAKYWSLPGSILQSMLIKGDGGDYEGVVAVVESYLCGMLLNQETGVTVVALGGVNAPLSTPSLNALRDARIVLLVLDNDDAGYKTAVAYQSSCNRAVISTAPKGKDVTDAWAGGLDLALFMRVAVMRAEEELAKRPADPLVQSLPEEQRPLPVMAVSRTLKNPSPVRKKARPPRPREYRYLMDVAEAKKAIRSLVKTNDLVAVDIETAKHLKYWDHPKAGLDPHLSRIRLVQLCGRTGEPLIIDAFACRKHLKEILAPVFAGKTVAHNAVFEMKHLAHVGVDTGVMDCTMLMYNALTNLTHGDPAPGGGSGGALSLKNVLHTCLDVDLKKEEQLSDWGAPELSEEQLRYAAGDVRHLARLHDRLLNRLRPEGLEGVYRRMRDAQPAVVAMELGGMRFDTKRHAEMMDDWSSQIDPLTKEVQKVMGEKINPKSTQQLGNFLRQVLPTDRLAAWPKTPKGDLKTTEAVLETSKDLPGIAPLLDLRKVSKLLSTYGKEMAGLVNPITGHLSASFHLAGAVTGRMSSSKPSFQNLPREAIREVFLADPGHVILTADYSQIELRVAAQLANDKTLLEAYRKGVDIHQFTASLLFSCPEGEVSKEQRQMAKAVAFGTLFGQGDKGLQEYARKYGVEITLVQAKELQQKLFATYAGLRRWRENTQRSAFGKTPVKTKGGRVRRFGAKEEGVFPKSLNTPIQGTAAEILLRALTLVIEPLGLLDARLVSTVHDEIVLTCHEKDADQAEELLKDCMTRAYLEMFPGAPTTGLVKCGRGKNWAEAK